MAGIRMFEEQLQLTTPHTFNALQHLVMSMASVVKNLDKRTFFGRDKAVESYAKFLSALKLTIHSMILDGVVAEATPTDEVLTQLEQKLCTFAMAFPNWQDAYGFAGTFLGERRADAISTVNRLRSTP